MLRVGCPGNSQPVKNNADHSDASNDNKSEAPRSTRETENSTKDSCSAINSSFRLSSTLQIEKGNTLLRKIFIFSCATNG